MPPKVNEPPESCPRMLPCLYRHWQGGVGAALNRNRTPKFEDDLQTTEHVLTEEYFSRIKELMPGTPGWGSPQEVEQAIEAIVRRLNQNRASLLIALHNPLAVVHNLEELSANSIWQWAAWCWVTEAAWRTLHPLHRPSEHQLTDTEIALYAPVAARQRFMALSEPFRHGYEHETARRRRYRESVVRVFGKEPAQAQLLATRAREAREEWASFLARHESLPALDRAEWDELESETDLLLSEGGQEADTGRGQRPLAIHKYRWEPEHKNWQPFTGEDRRVATSLLERHHLPRFRLLPTWRTTSYLIDRPGYDWILTVGLVRLTALTLLYMLLSSLTSGVLLALAASVLPLLVFGVGIWAVLVFGRLWAMPLMLRVPAAGAIGLLMLTTMNPAWWEAAFAGTSVLCGDDPCSRSGPHPLLVALLLSLAAFGYLLVNVRNTGISGRESLCRASAVLGIAALHSFLVASVGLAWIVPLFSENGDVFVDAWAEHPWAALTALLQASAWCLVAGVFSQILWDDRPLTAPLAHAHWRAEER